MGRPCCGCGGGGGGGGVRCEGVLALSVVVPPITNAQTTYPAPFYTDTWLGMTITGVVNGGPAAPGGWINFVGYQAAGQADVFPYDFTSYIFHIGGEQWGFPPESPCVYTLQLYVGNTIGAGPGVIYTSPTITGTYTAISEVVMPSYGTFPNTIAVS